MPESSKPQSIAIIGAGVSGLAGAHRLVSQNAAARVTVFESADRVGGIIRTEKADGWLIEGGPDSFITNKPAAVELCNEVGFTPQLIPTDNTFRRSLVLRDGKPMPVPAGFTLMAPANAQAVLDSPVLSAVGKQRLLAEEGVPPKSTFEDESLSSFVRRRFGDEAFERLVQPLIGGIYTANPERLSLLATLPRFLEQERDFGSVIAATKANQRAAATQEKPAESGAESGARYGLFATARNGLSDLANHVRTHVEATGRAEFRLNTAVSSVSRQGEHWAVTVDDQVHVFDAVVLCVPLPVVGKLLTGPDFAGLRQAVLPIEYASSAIVVSGYRLADVQHPLDAFGLVIPSQEARRILAVSFSSRKFPDRAPEGHVLMRTFVGGAIQAELLEHSDEELTKIVHEELTEILGVKAQPVLSRVVRWKNAMPQYHVGHLERVAAIETELKKLNGFELAGSAFHGVGLPDSIASGRAAADRIF